MDLFLAHFLILIWTALGTMRRLATPLADQLLGAGLLVWGNLVFTGLVLSSLGQLGQPQLYFEVSTLVATLVWLAMLRWALPQPAASAQSGALSHGSPNGWLVAAFLATLAPLACAILSTASIYPPNNGDSFTYQLPRVLYYLGQGNLTHFAAADLRLVELPFNFSLVQLSVFIYGAPLQCLNFFNVAAWALGGVAVYRLCRLCGAHTNASLVTCWLVLTVPTVLAQAASTTIGLPVATGLLGVFVFGLRSVQSQRARDIVMTGLAVGIVAGSDLRALLIAIVAGVAYLARSPSPGKSRRVGEPLTVILAVLLAASLSLPFAVLDLVARGSHAFDVVFNSLQNPSAPGISGVFYSPWRKPLPLDSLNEDLVGFGLSGLGFLGAALFCLAQFRRRSAPGHWFAAFGVAWISLSVLFHRDSVPFPRAFIPALMGFSPAMAGLIQNLPTRPQWRRVTTNAGVTLFAFAALWSGGLYLLFNTSRPFAPLVNPAIVRPTLAPLPMLLEYHLRHQTRINIDSDGIDESIFPLLSVGHGQSFTSQPKIDPAAYNLLSRSSASRNSGYLTSDSSPAYAMLPIPSKRTAGVEFLATIGVGNDARDYLGLGPSADGTAPINSNRNLLITLYHVDSPEKEPSRARIKVAGLNPGDRDRLAVSTEYDNGQKVPLTSFATDGEQVVTVVKPFRQLAFRARDINTGAEIGAVVIPYRSRPVTGLAPVESTQPTSANSIFVTDLVLNRTSRVTASEGLFPTEGPFPQWDLPFVRWARRPIVSLRIPPTEHLDRVLLSFSVRLHVRRKGCLEVWINGRFARRYRMEDPTVWLDRSVEFVPQAGENIVEFRDAPLNNEPDWLDYLERYPDVKDYLLSRHLPLEQGARDHYESNGRAEGRTVRIVSKPEPAPDSYYFMFRSIRLEGFKSP